MISDADAAILGAPKSYSVSLVPPFQCHRVHFGTLGKRQFLGVAGRLQRRTGKANKEESEPESQEEKEEEQGKACSQDTSLPLPGVGLGLTWRRSGLVVQRPRVRSSESFAAMWVP